MNLSVVLGKLKRKGLYATLRTLCERYLFSHCRLLWLQREVAMPPPNLQRSHQWRYLPITRELLPAFHKHFAHHLMVMGDLLEMAGVHGLAALDRDGDVCAFLWFSERDYYDRHYHRCWFPVETYSVYLFAVEIAPGHRGSALLLGAQESLWQMLRVAGYQRAQTVVNARNGRTLKLLKRLGFRPLGRQFHIYTLFGTLRFSRQQSDLRVRIERLSGTAEPHD